MNQIVNSIPKHVVLKTSCVVRQQLTSTQSAQGVSVELNSRMARRVQFNDAKKEYEPCSDCSNGDETSSGDETLSGESCSIGPGQDDLSGESMSGQPRDSILSGSREK